MTARVIVTGGGDSIGRAIAENFCHKDGRVFICDMDKANLVATLESNPGMEGELANLGSADGTNTFFDAALNALGGCDVLVNTVGAGGPRALVEDIELDEWHATFAANVDATLIGMQKVVPGMKIERSGSIVNISSASTKTGMVARSAYVAAKCAVEGLTRNAARELGEYGIRCNAVLPGIIDNARMRSVVAAVARDEGVSAEDMESRFLKFVSTRSKVSTGEVAGLVDYLCSSAAQNITGQTISIDGNLEWEA
ncbi:SDR family oxidoreductase [Parasphingopyxis algicola]|uniref:SDR family oxidoreductase n=1 Tax=Parasphingopyxis algicola TaxID=2026624 RepID=UPI0015A3411B|nr:SDR family oxidoreductase [Parasphingopyxis algicola]QLC23928.1 SDR family oxidoreductase [Parasphingopyxis algicola]